MEYAIEVLEEGLKSCKLNLETLKGFARFKPIIPEREAQIKSLETAIQKLRGEM